MHELVTAAQLINEARGLVGVPWIHQGRGMKGVDCIGFISLAFHRAGIDLPVILGVKDRRDYTRDPSPALVMLVEKHCERVSAPVPGSLILFQFNTEAHPRHFAIYTYDRTIIHACAKHGSVIEHGYRGHWVRWTNSIWRLPAVSYDIP